MSGKDGDARDLRNMAHEYLDIPAHDKLDVGKRSEHKPRILLLYGSLREKSYSRLLTFEAAHLLNTFGAETRIYDPHGLPLPDGAPETRKARNCASWQRGRKDRCGPRPSATAP